MWLTREFELTHTINLNIIYLRFHYATSEVRFTYINLLKISPSQIKHYLNRLQSYKKLKKIYKHQIRFL